MKTEWVKLSEELAVREGDLYDGDKKRFRHMRRVFHDPLNSELTVDDAGFGKSKMTLLKKMYIHEESLAVAVSEWDHRLKKKKYGSVGFTCYNHLMKSHTNNSPISSRQGPCLQAVTVTMFKEKALIDVFYRTTELFKKFPADLVLIRDHLLPRFNFTEVPVENVTMHAANVTVSPTYFSTILPHVEDSIELLDRIKVNDPRFHRSCCRWLFRYLDGDEVQWKFNQAKRAGNALRRAITNRERLDILGYVKEEVK